MKYLMTVLGDPENDTFSKASIEFEAPHAEAAYITAKDLASALETKSDYSVEQVPTAPTPSTIVHWMEEDRKELSSSLSSPEIIEAKIKIRFNTGLLYEQDKIDCYAAFAALISTGMSTEVASLRMKALDFAKELRPRKTQSLDQIFEEEEERLRRAAMPDNLADEMYRRKP